MAKKNFYGVVLSNGETGVFANWDEAKAFIATCPSAARYKGFSTRDEAQAFVDPTAAPVANSGPTEAFRADCEPGELFIAYVDGSFNPAMELCGYGVVGYDATTPDVHVTLCGCSKQNSEMRNVVGEVLAAKAATKYAIEHGYKRIEIYHDYTGIACWANGSWRAKNVLTQEYQRYMETAMQQIEVSFRKVAAHTGVELNEEVDHLAKKACGIQDA